MNIKDQLEWEVECLDRGSRAYYNNQDRLREQGQGDTTDAMSTLIRERLEDAASDLEATIGKGRAGVHNKYNSLIVRVAQGDYLRVSYIALKTVLAMLTTQKRGLTRICAAIGSRIEVDLKCQMFEAKHPAYFDTVRRSFAEQNVTDFNHKQKVMMKKFGDFDILWNNLSVSEKTALGARLVKSLLNTFGDLVFIKKEFRHGKQTWVMDTTVEFDEWAAEIEKEVGLLNPSYLPLKIQPRDWTSLTDGGYFSPRMKMPFVKCRGKKHKQFVAEHVPQMHIKAVNKMQKTAWQINEEVLSVQEEIYQKGLRIGMPSNVPIKPPEFPDHLKDIDKEYLTEGQKEELTEWKVLAKNAYGKEINRKGKILAFIQSHKLAKELREWDKFYFVYNCDFRGRLYCATAGLSPQGADIAKGLLRFAEPKVLGYRGVYWLAIQGANTFGYDKASYDDRVKFIEDMELQIQAVVDDPITHRNIWGNADKPYQFLAFCFEWENCKFGRDPRAYSHIPVGLDGSCNGLQHYSAMLRDPIGAKATNLTDNEKPEDIYQYVADATTRKLQNIDHPYAAVWLRVGISRKCAKRPVMTLPYGATQQSARTYILEYIEDNWAQFELDETHKFQLAKFLTPILWAAIGDVVIAAREGMDFLRKNVGNDYTKWITPIGFPVYQYYKDVPHNRVRTQLEGNIVLATRDIENHGTPAKFSQKNGVAPNFVHSLDSTHLVMTVCETDYDAYAMIHDDFGTHAADAGKLQVAIQNQFHLLYNNHCPLTEWRDQCAENTVELPNFGDYDLNDILNAAYFFG